MAQISTEQNKKLHALFRDIANALADEGVTVQELIRDSFEMIPTEESIKWITKQLLNKAWGLSSTQEMSNEQYSTVIDMWAKKTGGHGVEIDYE